MHPKWDLFHRWATSTLICFIVTPPFLNTHYTCTHSYPLPPHTHFLCLVLHLLQPHSVTALLSNWHNWAGSDDKEAYNNQCRWNKKQLPLITFVLFRHQSMPLPHTRTHTVFKHASTAWLISTKGFTFQREVWRQQKERRRRWWCWSIRSWDRWDVTDCHSS